MYFNFITVNGKPGEPALCQLYRYTFVPYSISYRRSYVSLVRDAARRCVADRWQLGRWSADTSPEGEAARPRLRPGPRCPETCPPSSSTARYGTLYDRKTT